MEYLFSLFGARHARLASAAINEVNCLSLLTAAFFCQKDFCSIGRIPGNEFFKTV